jgi:hypothetical protein
MLRSGRGAIKGSTLVLILLLLFFGLLWLGWLKLPVSVQPGQQTTTQAGTVVVNKPIKFALSDPLAGSAIASATIQIYGPDKVLKETLTTASDGTATSALPYQSDSIIYVKVAKASYVMRWFTITVPRMTPADAQSLAANFVALQTARIGTYSIKLTDQFGNVYTSPANVNFTTLGATTVTITINIFNSVDNTGYFTSQDFLNGITLNAALVLSTGGSAVTVTGAGSSVVRGTTTYYVNIVSDDGLTRQLVGNVYVKQGVTSVTITFGKGSLAHGSTQSFTITLYAYFDQGYFAANGIGGPDSTSLASFTLNLQA